jgi:hypothetical protein
MGEPVAAAGQRSWCVEENLFLIQPCRIPNHAPATNQIKNLAILLSTLIFGLCRKRAVNLKPRHIQGA